MKSFFDFDGFDFDGSANSAGKSFCWGDGVLLGKKYG